MIRYYGKRAFSLFLVLVMLLGMMPAAAFAEGNAEECTHHPEHVGCAYVEKVEGVPCSHKHDENCGYSEGSEAQGQCSHVCSVDTGCITSQPACQHQHVDCGYVPAVEGVACQCQPDENGVLTHVENCGFVEAVEGVACPHQCGEDCYTLVEACVHQHVDCGYTPAVEGTACQHKHDENCGFVEAVEGVACDFVCSECSAKEEEKGHQCESEPEEVMLIDSSTAWYCPDCNGIFDSDWNLLENPQLMQNTLDEPVVDGVAINETNFPDAAFRNYILNGKSYEPEVKFDANSDEHLSSEEIAAIVKLDIPGGTANLKGIEYFAALKYLWVTGTAITTLDLSGNPSLNTLECGNNPQLSSFNISANSALTELYFHGNPQITSLNLSGNVNLAALRCEDDSNAGTLSSLDLSQNTALTVLWCNGNKLKTLELGHIPGLKSADNTSLVLNSQNISATAEWKDDVCVVDMNNIVGSENLSKVSINSSGVTYESSTGLVTLNNVTESSTASFTYFYTTGASRNLGVNVSVTVPAKPVVQKTLESIAITTEPDKTGYIEGESFDPAGMVVTATYSDASTAEVSRYSLSPNGALKGTDTTITVSYEENGVTETAVQTIEIIAHAYDNSSEEPCYCTVCEKVTTFNNYPAQIDIPGNLLINSINFPDNNFRTYVDDSLPHDVEDYFTPGEASKVSEIDCSFKEIESLKGIEFFGNLSVLNCSWNKIATLDMSKNKALTDLNCERFNANSSNTLDLSGHSSLKVLSCNAANLTSLNLSGCSALEELYCGSTSNILNKLSALDVSACPELRVLSCSNNKLTSLDLSNNSKLQTLDCSGTGLTALDVSHCKKLEVLSCGSTSHPTSKNYLTSLNVSENTALRTLYCNGNPLGTLNLANNLALQKLWCSNIGLTELNVSSNTALTELDCSNNDLFELDISKNTALTKLTCSYNNLSELDLSNNSMLRELRCYYNRLAGLDISNNTNKLVDLGCSYQEPSATASWNGSQWILDLGAIAGGNKGIPESVSGGDYDSASGILILSDVDESSSEATVTYTNDVIRGLSSSSGLYKMTGITLKVALVKEQGGSHSYVDDAEDPCYCTVCKKTTTFNGSPAQVDILGNLLINKVNFPDDTFRSFVKENYASGRDILTVSTLSKVGSMACSGMDITDLKGVEYFTALTTLECDNNQLSKLDVSKNTALTMLKCNDNDLSELDISHNTALKNLYCGYNQLSKLDVSKNTALTYIHCGNNHIPSMDISMLSSNTVNVTGWSQSVTATAVQNGCIFELDMKTVVAPGTIDKVSITTSGISMDSNGIIKLNGDEEIYYTYDTGKNQELSVSLKLELELDPDESLLINETNFPDPIFREYIKTFAKASEDKSFLTPYERDNVKDIRCESKGIESLKGIEHFGNLETLYCGNNALTELDLSKNTELKYLHCGGCGIETLDVSGLEKLEVLDFRLTENSSYTKIKSVDVSGCTALKSIYCNYNALTELDLSDASALTRLECGNNQMPKLDIPDTVDNWKGSPQNIAVKAYKNGDAYELDMSKLVGLDNLDRLSFVYPSRPEFDETTGIVKLSGSPGNAKEIQYSYTVNSNKTMSVFLTVTLCDECMVSFDANGGSGTMAAVNCAPGTIYTLPANGFTAPTGKQFKAWQVGEAEYKPGDKLSISADTTIKAVWENIPVTLTDIAITTAPTKTAYTVGEIFDPAGMVVTATYSDSSSKVLTEDEYTYAPSTALTADVSSITVSYKDDATKTATQPITVSAAPATYTVTYDANGGTGSMTDGTATEGVAFSLPANGFTAPANKQFKAWQIGSTEYQPGDTYTFTANTAVKAVWEDIPATAPDYDGAKDAINEQVWAVAQAVANSAEQLKPWIEEELEDILKDAGIDDVSISNVVVSDVVPAVAGTAADKDGTDGSFKFTATLSEKLSVRSILRSTKTATETVEITKGKIVATPYVPSGHVHDWSEDWTCNSSHHWHECKDSSCKIVADYDRHSFSAWKTVKHATATTAGLKTRSCRDCGYVQQLKIAAGSSPSTGDTANLPLWMSLMALGLGGLAVTGHKLRTKKGRHEAR